MKEFYNLHVDGILGCEDENVYIDLFTFLCWRFSKHILIKIVEDKDNIIGV